MTDIIKEYNKELFVIKNSNYKIDKNTKKYDFYYKKANIPESYKHIEFIDYISTTRQQEDSNFKVIIGYANNIDKPETEFVNLYLYGEPTTQKTALACNILKFGLVKGLKVKFIQSNTLFKYLLTTNGFNINEEYQKKIEEIFESDIICIDDIFSKKHHVTYKSDDNNMIISCFDSFLRQIITTKTRIILTSNTEFDNIKNIFGEYVHELVNRNFKVLNLTSNITHVIKEKLENKIKETSKDISLRTMDDSSSKRIEDLWKGKKC
jgi:DNA replication protein DnaC